LQSDNKLHTFIMQQDGNTVFYDRDSKPLWSTNTGELIAPSDFVVQTDGNLVLYSAAYNKYRAAVGFPALQ